MEHIISDAYSRDLVLREVLSTYAREGRCGHLPPVGMQFPDYATWQRSLQPQLEANRSFLVERLQGCRRLEFPADRGERVREFERVGWGQVSFIIPEDVKGQLRRWCQDKRTTLAMGALTAFSAMVLLWYRVSDAAILYQSDGRNSPQVENTVGFLASTLYLKVGLGVADNWLDLLKRVTHEFCVAYDHADQSLLETQATCPEYLSNPGFNWIAQSEATQKENLTSAAGLLLASPFDFVNPVLGRLDLDSEPHLMLRDVDARILGAMQFPMKRYSPEAMQRFARAFIACLSEMATNPERLVRLALERP
jgi:hypothetical protein